MKKKLKNIKMIYYHEKWMDKSLIIVKLIEIVFDSICVFYLYIFKINFMCIFISQSLQHLITWPGHQTNECVGGNIIGINCKRKRQDFGGEGEVEYWEQGAYKKK